MSIDTNVKAQFDPTVQRIVGETVAAYGSLPINAPYISEIATNLWQGGCPSPFDGPPTPKIILPKFIKHVVSLYQGGHYRIPHPLVSNVTVVMADGPGQSMAQADVLAEWVNVCRQSGAVLVHCQAGLNRSGLVTARALMLEGMSSGEAIALLREKRSPAVLCNPEFEKYLRSLDA